MLGGRAMQLVHNVKELEKYLKDAVEVSNSKPILLDGYLTDAIEVDVDVLRWKGIESWRYFAAY